MIIAVTGGKGWLGSRLAAGLRVRGHDVVALDRDDGDLVQTGVAEDLFVQHKPQIVVHMAAQVGRLWCDDDPAHAYESNVVMTERVASATASAGARLVYVSTSEVYGNHGDRTLDEDASVFPTSGSYAKTKLIGEYRARKLAPEGLQIIRPVMPYGPGVPAGRGRAAIINVLWAALHHEQIVVHQGGERSWTYVDDIISGMAMVIESEISEVFNVGRDDDRISMVALARLACDLAGAPKSLVVEEQAPSKQTLVKRLSSAKLRSLGWRPTVSLREGMRVTLEWLDALDVALPASSSPS